MRAYPEARAIQQDNVLLVGPFPDGRRLDDARNPGKLASGFRRCNIALVVAWPGVGTPYPSINRLLHQNGVAYSLILCGPPDTRPHLHDEPVPMPRALAAFFPIEDPSPCWRCLELRWLGWTSRPSSGLQWLESLQFPQRFPQFAEPLPDEEQRVLLSWMAMDVLGADAGTVRRVAEDGTYTTHSFLPHPQCAWCSPWVGVKPSRHVERAVPAVFADPHFGLLRLPSVPASLDPPPPAAVEPDPVFQEALSSAVVPHLQRLPIAHGSPYYASDDAEFTEVCRASPGKASLPSTAIFEALALYSMRLRAGRPLWRGTRRGVALPAPNPRDWIFPLLGEVSGRHFDEHMELDWMRGHDLQSGDAVGIPADLVFTNGPYAPMPPHDSLAFADVSLAAAGPTLESAVQGALARVAENDALMATWYAGLPPPRVPSERLPPPFTAAVKKAEKLGAEIAVLDLTTEIGVPVLAVVGRKGQQWFYGCGAAMVAPLALHAAWTQLGQACARRVPHPGACIDFLFSGPERDFPPSVPGGDTDPIDTWRYLLDVRGMQAVWIDLTPPDVVRAQVVVARAWIAGAIPRPPPDVPLDLDADRVTGSAAGIRLLELPMRMNLSDVPLQPEDLNAAPHPFV